MSTRAIEGTAGAPPAPTQAGPPSIGLLQAKLRPPSQRPGLVTRTALLDRLAASSAPIASVVAPGGYGKSTLLGQWAERCPLASTWLSLDQFDDDPGVLLAYLLAAIGKIEPDPEAQQALLAEAAVDSSWSLRSLAVLVSSIRTPFLLVLDHVDLVTDKRGGDLIAAVALNLPEGSRMVLGSRVEPPLPMPRLRAHGMVEELDRNDLTMDEQEATLLLEGAGMALTADKVGELVADTEGWPVGLYLASLAMKGGGAGTVRSLRGDDRVVADYLRAEVIAGLAPSAVTFLTRTSVLDRLNGSLCDSVMATSGSQELLESLEASNLLLVPLDRQRQWYRCHHLLGELLRAELERSEPDLVSRLHDRAAAWFEANGQPDRALEHAQAAGDADRAARLFGQIAQVANGAGRADTVLRWLSWFDEQGVIGQYPQVAVLGAFVEALSGGMATSRLLADAAGAGDRSAPTPDGSPLDSWIAALETCLCRRGVGRMREDAAQAREQLSRLSPLRGPVTVLEGIAAVLEGKRAEADPLLAAGAELCLRSVNFPGAAAALAERAVIALERGDTGAARMLSDQALEIVSERHVEAYAQATVVFAAAARIEAQAGQVQAARRNVAAAARLRPRCTASIPWSAQFLVQLAYAYLALGDPGGARAVLRQVRDITLMAPDLGVLLDECAALTTMLDTISTGSVGASSLTAAELRLLPLLATHLSYKDIGERLHVSRNTIKSEAASVFRKLGASSRSEAVELAERIGLLGP